MGLITKNYIFLSIFASNIYFLGKTEGLTYLDLGYVVFWSCNPGVYESWGICNEQISGFSGASYISYHTRVQAEVAYGAFLEHEKQKLRPQVVHASSAKQVPKILTWKDIVIINSLS
jgi:hypothetical protein